MICQIREKRFGTVCLEVRNSKKHFEEILICFVMASTPKFWPVF